MSNIRFIYQAGEIIQEREIVAREIFQFLKNHIDLPDSIEIAFANIHESVYGATHLNSRFKNRITINSSLTYNEIPPVLIHEFIHLNQIKMGRLYGMSNGMYKWDNKIYNIKNYPNYDELPWEVDVVNRQHNLLVKTYQHFAPPQT